MPPSRVIDEIIRMAEKWKPMTVRIDVGGQQEIYADVIRNLENKRGIRMLTYRPREQKSKLYLEGLEPWFYKRKVYLTNGMHELKDELLAFRTDMRHKHDDMIDAMFYAFHRALPPSHTVSAEKGRQSGDEPVSNKNSWMLS